MTEKIKTVDYEQPIQDESELSAEIEDSSERSQKIGQETIKSHERLDDEEPIPEMAMIKAGRVENKAQARMDFARLKHLKNKLESGEAFTAEDLAFIYEKDHLIERTESVDGTPIIVELRGSVRKILENNTKLEDVMGAMSLNEQVLNVNILIDYGLDPNDAVELIGLCDSEAELEPYEPITIDHFIEQGLDLFDRKNGILSQLGIEDIMEYYDMLTDPKNGEKAYTPDEIIATLTNGEKADHIDFILKIKPDFNVKDLLDYFTKFNKTFPSDKIGQFISCGVKPEELFSCIDYTSIEAEHIKALLVDEEAITQFIKMHYDIVITSAIDVFETVFDMIPDDQLEKYIPMLGATAYLRNYNYLQSRGIKLTPEQGTKLLKAYPDISDQCNLDLYFPAIDDIADLCEQGSIENTAYGVSDIIDALLSSTYQNSCLDNIDIIARHCGNIDIKGKITYFIQGKNPEIILRNAEKLLNALGGDFAAAHLLITHSFDSWTHSRSVFQGESAKGLAMLIRSVNAGAEATGQGSSVDDLIRMMTIKPDSVAYNLEIFLDNGVDVDIDWLVKTLCNQPKTLLDNYNALAEHGAKIDIKQLARSLAASGEHANLKVYSKIHALDPEAIDATTALTDALKWHTDIAIYELDKWQEMGADINKAFAAHDELTRVSGVSKLLKLGVDPNLLASKMHPVDLLKDDAIEILLHAGASIDFGRFLRGVEILARNNKFSRNDASLDKMIRTLATNMPDVTPLVKVISDPATLERNKALLTACGANL